MREGRPSTTPLEGGPVRDITSDSQTGKNWRTVDAAPHHNAIVAVAADVLGRQSGKVIASHLVSAPGRSGDRPARGFLTFVTTVRKRGGRPLCADGPPGGTRASGTFRTVSGTERPSIMGHLWSHRRSILRTRDRKPRPSPTGTFATCWVHPSARSGTHVRGHSTPAGAHPEPSFCGVRRGVRTVRPDCSVDPGGNHRQLESLLTHRKCGRAERGLRRRRRS